MPCLIEFRERLALNPHLETWIVYNDHTLTQGLPVLLQLMSTLLSFWQVINLESSMSFATQVTIKQFIGDIMRPLDVYNIFCELLLRKWGNIRLLFWAIIIHTFFWSTRCETWRQNIPDLVYLSHLKCSAFFVDRCPKYRGHRPPWANQCIDWVFWCSCHR